MRIMQAMSLALLFSAAEAEARLTANRLAGNKLAVNKIAANKIAAHRLSNDGLQLAQNSDELLATADGREVLSYLIGCAIPEGQVLVGTSGGVTYEFFGELGLAEEWIHRRLNQTGRGWVSACVFARANIHSVALPLSVRGPHPGLSTSADEREGWTLEEGAFYGELFTPGNEPINWIACRGRDQAAGEIGGLSERDCAEPDPMNPGKTICGFNYAGDCGDFAPEPVCEAYSPSGTFYRNCHGQEDAGDDDGDGRLLDWFLDQLWDWVWMHGDYDGKRYRQVITTFAVE
jgi:hypothetical protein